MEPVKFSVILTNYNTPLDRFTAYHGVHKTATDLIDLCGQQKIATGVEMLASPGATDLNPHNKKEVAAALKHNGLVLAGLLPITWSAEYAKGSLGNPDAKVRRCAIDFMKESIDLAAELGCSYVGQWPGQDGWDYCFEVNYQQLYDWWVAGMQELADHNPEVRLGIEPKPYEPRAYSFIDNNMKALLMARDIDRKNVGLTLDIGHSMYGHESLAEAVALANRNGRLFHLHLNDNYGDMDGDMPFGSVHLMSLVELFYWLRRTGYDGWHSVDIFAYRTDPADTILESLKWMQAVYNLVDRAGMENLEALVEKSDGVAIQRFFRELLFN